MYVKQLDLRVIFECSQIADVSNVPIKIFEEHKKNI